MNIVLLYRITTDGSRSTLTIANPTIADSAWFQCSAVNVSGSASTRAKLTVIGNFIVKYFLKQTLKHSPINALFLINIIDTVILYS